ncbi:acyl-CoA thioesterase [Enhygromyxa salina]|uniref:acyl-CoA thioesterase n=1 Tax=Enhygromyxa salina TaxID=215803 RepID=UPI002159379B|nr:acyl-CoA thioesterase [Enhygromyxa salina]
MTASNVEPDPHPAIRVCMMPADTNAHGTIFGGKILSLIDQAGAIGAHRLGIGRVVTVAMREVVFSQPVRVGDIVSCYAEILRVGRTSVTVCVRVVAHRPTDTKRSVEVTKAEVVYVAIDDAGRPVPIEASSASSSSL